MKIELEIPDDLIGDKNLYIFAGMEHIAVKRPGKQWVIKDGLCSMCGSCCQGTHIRNMNLPIKDDRCVFLRPHPTEEGKLICGWGGNRPFACCIGSPRFEPNCTVKWRVAE